MYICFIDESGTPPKPTATNPTPFWVLAGVIIHEAQWKNIADELVALKHRYRVRGEIKWRYFGPHNNDPDNSVAHLDQSKRDDFRQKMYEILTKRNSTKIIYSVCAPKLAYEKPWINTQADLYFQTYKPSSERFQYFLQDMGREVGTTQRGIVVADHQGRKQDDTLRKQHDRMVGEDAAFTSSFGNYVETIFLTPSHHSPGIQFADMVAGAIGRKVITNESRFYDLLSKSFRRSATGKLRGYGEIHVPNS
ncbi:MAG: DUF3800 domain-containing protein [Pseudomonadota bacterium]